jgi:hypothetical protein
VSVTPIAAQVHTMRTRGARSATSRSAHRQHELLPALSMRGVALVAVSPQKPDGRSR